MVAIDNKTAIGVGAYSVPQAARIVGAHYSTVRSWIAPSTGVIPRYFNPDRQTLSFVELMELNFIKIFRSEGVSLHVIRLAARAASKKYNSDYPFAVKRFDTDGKTIFATLERQTKEGDLIEDLRRGQFVFSQIMRPFFRKLDYQKAEIVRYWPLGKRRRVVLDPNRRLGQPLDDASGIPTRVLHTATLAGGGQSIREVSDWYGVPVAAVKRAVEFEQSIQT